MLHPVFQRNALRKIYLFARALFGAVCFRWGLELEQGFPLGSSVNIVFRIGLALMQFLIRPLFFLLTLRRRCRGRFRSRLKRAHRLPLSLEFLEDRITPSLATWSGA